jgi:hypothetical protein
MNRRSIIISVVAAAVGILLLLGTRAMFAGNDRAEDPSTAQATTPEEYTPVPATPPAPPSTTIMPDPPDPGSASPDAVTEQALQTMFTWNPASDVSGADAFARATPWLTARIARPDAAAARNTTRPTPNWDYWKTRGIRITAHVELSCSGCSPDTAERVQRTATIMQTAVAADGRTAVIETPITAWVTVIRQDDGWRVDELGF